jgi:hypothetical protein
MNFRVVRIVSALLLAGVAVLHVTQALAAGPSAARHWLFVGLNLGLAALLVWRHRWAFWPALALSIQQVASHGLELSDSFLGTVPLDWQSLAVCLFFPTLVTVLFIERRDEDEREAAASASE